LVQRCLAVGVVGPFIEISIVECTRSIFVDAIIPLGIGDIPGSVFEEKRSVIEDKTHSLSLGLASYLILL
jgi:hypothetical protein